MEFARVCVFFLWKRECVCVGVPHIWENIEKREKKEQEKFRRNAAAVVLLSSRICVWMQHVIYHLKKTNSSFKTTQRRNLITHIYSRKYNAFIWIVFVHFQERTRKRFCFLYIALFLLSPGLYELDLRILWVSESRSVLNMYI